MRFLKTLIFMVIAFSMTACFNTREDLWINADGSGHHELSYDLSNMASFIKMGMADKLKKTKSDSTSTKKDDKTPDFIKRMMSGEKLDTIIRVKDLAEAELQKEGLSWEDAKQEIYGEMEQKESMTEEVKASLGKLMDRLFTFELHLESNLDKNIFKFGFKQQFENLESFSSLGKDTGVLFEYFNKIKGAEGKEISPDKLSAFLEVFNSTPMYELDGKVLKIKRRGLDLSALGEEGESQMSMIGMMMGAETHKLVVHLPGKVKRIHSDDVKKIDKKTIVIETPVADMYDPEKRLNAEITFKRKRKYYKKKH